ncbi:MAG: hypothetical protein GWP04_05755 [Gammaproteobacteria bacterium]|nr:hypothetical protein [Gammaproteobacteria bacterium]
MKIIPRYEFRVWGDDLDSAQAQLLELGTRLRRKQTSETYIVSHVEQTNVKIRAGVLDIKQLLDRWNRLERWKPVFKLTFPVESRVLATSVFPQLGVEAPLLPAGPLGEETFVAVADCLEGVMAVPVQKVRSLVSIGACRVEAGVVTVDGSRHLTVAVESADPSVVEETVALLDIGGRRNESYPAMLRRLRWA